MEIKSNNIGVYLMQTLSRPFLKLSTWQAKASHI